MAVSTLYLVKRNLTVAFYLSTQPKLDSRPNVTIQAPQLVPHRH